MIRAPHATMEKPVPKPLRRLVLAQGQRRVLEITEETIGLRYPRARRPHLQISYSQLEHRLFLAEAAQPRPRRRRAR